MSDPRFTYTCDDVRDLAPLIVLGALERDEEAAIRAHVADCPDAHAELETLGAVVPALLADVEQVAPPPALKSRILAAAAADLEARGAVAAPEAAAVPGSRPADVIPLRRRPTPMVEWAFRIAAVLAIVALGVWNLQLQGRLDESIADRAAFAAVVELAAQEGSTTAVLTGEARGLAAVATSGETRFAFEGLVPTSGGEVYTAWSIAGEGSAPENIGEFTVDAGGVATLTARVDEPGSGLTLAITREPAPGATTPTLPIRAVGTTTG